MSKIRNNLVVIVIKNGEPREIECLPDSILEMLDDAWETAPIRGLRRNTYLTLAAFFEEKLKNYEEEYRKIDNSLYSKSVAFARAFDIDSVNPPEFFDMMLYIERSVKEHPEKFSSKDICCRKIKEMSGIEWFQANRGFKMWARRLFEDTGLRIGIVRMLKFFYGIITQYDLSPESVTIN